MTGPCQRHEDTHLELKPLPLPKLVATPEPLPNELFGDVVMVTTFISCYRGLLMPEDDQPVSTGRTGPDVSLSMSYLVL